MGYFPTEKTVTDRIEYSPYGTVTHRTGTTDTPFLYNGRYGVMTDSNGLLHMRARYYNPLIRRFVNADPIGFDGGLNWYAYAGGRGSEGVKRKILTLNEAEGTCGIRVI